MSSQPNIRPLSEELRKVATEELNEVESRIADDIQALRTWIESQPHLKPRTDDQFLVTYLRSCKYSLEKTKQKIHNGYSFMALMPEMFTNKRMDEKNIRLVRTGCFLPLPNPLGPGGPALEIIRYGQLDTKMFNLIDVIRFQSMVLPWRAVHNDNFAVAGLIQICDMSKVSLALLREVNPILLKKLIYFAENGAPIRLKGTHYINCSKEAQFFFNITKSFLKPKLQKRYFMHSSLEQLYEHIPRQYLPIEYGGTNGTIAQILEETEKTLVANKDYFIEDDQYGVDESLRCGEKLDMQTLFGSEGSFRQLNID